MQTRAQLNAVQKRVQHQHEIAAATVMATSRRSSSLLNSMGDIREAVNDMAVVDCTNSKGFEHAVPSGKDSGIGRLCTLRTPQALKNEINVGGHGLEIARSESLFSQSESVDDNDQDTPLTRVARFDKHACMHRTQTRELTE